MRACVQMHRNGVLFIHRGQMSAQSILIFHLCYMVTSSICAHRIFWYALARCLKNLVRAYATFCRLGRCKFQTLECEVYLASKLRGLKCQN